MSSSAAKLTSSSRPSLSASATTTTRRADAHDRALDGRLVGVGGAQAEAGRDAVRADEGDIGPQALDGAHGVGADRGGGERADAAADDGERGARHLGQRVRQGQRVGDDLDRRCREAGGELSGHGRGGGAGVEEDRAAECLGDRVERAAADGGLRRAVSLERCGSDGSVVLARSRGTAPPWTRRRLPCASSWSRSRRTVSVVTSKRCASSTTLTRPSPARSCSISSCRSVAYMWDPFEDSHTLQHKPTQNKTRFGGSIRPARCGRRPIASIHARQARSRARDRRGARARAGDRAGGRRFRMPRPCRSRMPLTAGTARSGASASTGRCGSPVARSPRPSS